MNKYDLIIVGIIIFFSILLGALPGVMNKYKTNKWRILYLIPGMLVWMFSSIVGMDISMLPAYVAAVLLFVPFLVDGEKVKKLSSIVAIVCAALAVLVCFINPGYRVPDFRKEFNEVYEVMRERYCLTEHKGIDWDTLYAKYAPKFEEAYKNKDKVQNYILWQEFCLEFHDGHVSFQSHDKKVKEQAQEIMYGNDYGFSMMTLADGKTVAVNVDTESEAYKAGITEGTEIVKIDGKSIEEKKGEVKYFPINFPDKEGEDFYRAVLAAGLGGEKIEVCFVSEGTEKNVTLAKQGPYMERLIETIELVDQGMDVGTLTFNEVGEDAVVFRVKQMAYDSKSNGDGDYAELESEMREGLLEYKEKGKTKLIIDLRNNGGGLPDMDIAMAKLIASQGEHYYCSYAQIDEKTATWVVDLATGNYVVEGSISYVGENLWDQGEIILLTNAECASAGDHFVTMMSENPNVTIMGFTKSNGSGQAIRGMSIVSGDISFSTVPTLYEDGSIYVDAGVDRVAKVPLDVKIPFDEEACRSIFVDGEDYVLNYALQYGE